MADGNLKGKVLAFAEGKIGRRVGKGTCWDLPNEALSHAGAQSSSTTGAHDNYTWGVEVPLRQAAPGDILQFRDHVITTKVVTRITFKNGSKEEHWKEARQERGHHSAIVAANNGDTFEILEQNVKPKGRVVQRHTLQVIGGTTVEKTVREAKDSTGKLLPATIETRTTVTVSGFIWAYQPRVKP